MKKQVGLWIDHKQTFAVFVGDDGEQTKRVKSDMEKHVRFSGGKKVRRTTSATDNLRPISIATTMR